MVGMTRSKVIVAVVVFVVVMVVARQYQNRTCQDQATRSYLTPAHMKWISVDWVTLVLNVDPSVYQRDEK